MRVGQWAAVDVSHQRRAGPVGFGDVEIALLGRTRGVPSRRGGGRIDPKAAAPRGRAARQRSHQEPPPPGAGSVGERTGRHRSGARRGKAKPAARGVAATPSATRSRRSARATGKVARSARRAEVGQVVDRSGLDLHRLFECAGVQHAAATSRSDGTPSVRAISTTGRPRGGGRPGSSLMLDGVDRSPTDGIRFEDPVEDGCRGDHGGGSRPFRRWPPRPDRRTWTSRSRMRWRRDMRAALATMRFSQPSKAPGSRSRAAVARQPGTHPAWRRRRRHRSGGSSRRVGSSGRGDSRRAHRRRSRLRAGRARRAPHRPTIAWLSAAAVISTAVPFRAAISVASIVQMPPGTGGWLRVGGCRSRLDCRAMTEPGDPRGQPRSTSRPTATCWVAS